MSDEWYATLKVSWLLSTDLLAQTNPELLRFLLQKSGAVSVILRAVTTANQDPRLHDCLTGAFFGILLCFLPSTSQVNKASGARQVDGCHVQVCSLDYDWSGLL